MTIVTQSGQLINYNHVYGILIQGHEGWHDWMLTALPAQQGEKVLIGHYPSQELAERDLNGIKKALKARKPLFEATPEEKLPSFEDEVKAEKAKWVAAIENGSVNAWHTREEAEALLDGDIPD